MARIHLAFLLLLASAGVWAQTTGVLTQRSGNLTLIRDATVVSAMEGVTLHEGDILHTVASGRAQVEFPDGPTLSFGEATQVLLQSLPTTGSGIGLAVISGWVKFAHGKSRSGVLRIQMPSAQLTAQDATGVLHVAGGRIEVFVESGTVKFLGSGKASASSGTQIAKAGEFMSRGGDGRAAAIAARPSPEFIASMPRHFRDNLPTRIDRFKDKRTEAKRDHDVSYAEVESWLKTSRPVRRNFVARFGSRANDPEFRKGLVENLRAHPEWGPVLNAETAKKVEQPPAVAVAHAPTPAAPARAIAPREAPAATVTATLPLPPPAPKIEPPAPVAATATAVAAAPIVLPLNEAINAAARDLFGKAQSLAGERFTVVIDPLVDGSTGLQSTATAAVAKQVENLVANDFPKFQMKRLTTTNLSALPLVLIGTFTPINLQGKGAGERDAYRVCFALGDLRTGKIVSKGFSRAQTSGVDATPLPYFKDAPLWVMDRSVEGYIKTCQGTKAGDPINPKYLDAVVAVAAIDEATSAYNDRHYAEALALFTSVLRNPGGEQARVHTGIYLSNLRLGQQEAAMQAFGEIAQQGLSAKRLAVKFAFQSGGAGLANDGSPYDNWIKELAVQTARSTNATGSCLEVGGHTGRAGSQEMNERISLQRAEYIRQRLIAARPELAARISAAGYGSKAALVATGREDPSDALDRRIEFKSAPCL